MFASRNFDLSDFSYDTSIEDNNLAEQISLDENNFDDFDFEITN